MTWQERQSQVEEIRKGHAKRLEAMNAEELKAEARKTGTKLYSKNLAKQREAILYHLMNIETKGDVFRRWD